MFVCDQAYRADKSTTIQYQQQQRNKSMGFDTREIRQFLFIKALHLR